MGVFLGLYETLSYLMVRGDPQEHFLDYGFCRKNSKILHSHYKKCIPSSFLGTFFNSHRIQYESGAFQGLTFSNIYYFLPSTTDRVEETNRHMGSVNLTPIDIPENTFEVEDNVQFRLRVQGKRKNCQGCGQNALKKSLIFRIAT